MLAWIEGIVREKETLLKDLSASGYFDAVERTGTVLAQALSRGNKIMLAGNGGSAADAQHFAGELFDLVNTAHLFREGFLLHCL